LHREIEMIACLLFKLLQAVWNWDKKKRYILEVILLFQERISWERL